MSLVCPPRSKSALACCCRKVTCLVTQQRGKNLVGLGPTHGSWSRGFLSGFSPHSPAAEPSTVQSTVHSQSSPNPLQGPHHPISQGREVTLKEGSDCPARCREEQHQDLKASPGTCPLSLEGKGHSRTDFNWTKGSSER